MDERLRKFISDCATSSVGRFVFVAYLVYLVSMISFAYDHFPTMTYPFRFYGERELFQLMNAPQLALIRSSRLFTPWSASQLTDTLLAVYIALPWWIYGYVFELMVRRIARTASREALPGECARLIGTSEPADLRPVAGLRKVMIFLRESSL